MSEWKGAVRTWLVFFPFPQSRPRCYTSCGRERSSARLHRLDSSASVSRAATRLIAKFAKVFGVALALLTTAAQIAHAQQDVSHVSSDEILKTFTDSVLIQSGFPTDWYVAKWDTEVRIAIQSTRGAPPWAIMQLMSLISEIQKVTNTHVVITTHNVNFIVVVSDDISNELTESALSLRHFFSNESVYAGFMTLVRMQKPECASSGVSPRSGIQAFLLLIAVPDARTNPDTIKSSVDCMTSGLIAGFGMKGVPSSKIVPFDYQRQNTGFSELEQAVLATLYNSELRSGMKRDQAVDVVKKIIKQREQKKDQ